jgi:hypothetical protein
MSDTSGYALPREARWLGAKNRSHYIPGWYEPHTNLDLQVKHLGIPQGFQIGRVLPYRRWAVDADGNMLDQKTFEDQYMRYLGGFEVAATTDLRNESMPNVRAYVRMKLDRVGSLVDMDFEDDGAIVKTEKYTEHGEIAPEFLVKHQEQAKTLSKMEMLTQLVADGLLTPAQLAERVAQLLGPAADDAPIVAQPSQSAAAASTPIVKKKRGRQKGWRMKPKLTPAPIVTEAVQSLEAS